ncbi:MAG: hypothetical protein HYW37_02115 [Candidatus Colwellbacteria bacterium]|nr:hypothetical protein [Candidatus Colwellbacteria bacterium]
MQIFLDQRILRILTIFWTLVFFLFITLNLLLDNAYGFLMVPLGVIYTGVLTIYVGTKEFDRWYEIHQSKHPGEAFVIIWTIVMFALVVLPLVGGEKFRMPLDIIAGVYLAVLSLFAITQKSKSLHRKKRVK